MITEKMTVHKALAELKTLDSRIMNAMNGATFVVANKHSNKKILGETISEFSKNAIAAKEKVTTLIARRNAIKKAVVLSNATTIVTVAGEEYSVAEAIEMKNHGILLYADLRDKISSDYKEAQRIAERNNGEALEKRADDYVRSLYDNKADLKNLSAEAVATRNAFIENQQYELVDPIDCKKTIEALDNKFNAYMVDVDSALSVSNAITEIEVSY